MNTCLSPYHIVPSYFVLRDAEEVDRERLLFHINTGDYFAMVATALGFVEEKLSSLEKTPSQELRLLRTLKSDLQYLHAHYAVCPKKRPFLIPDSSKVL